MKLALHRSTIFWSGLLVMGFVCWAWWNSNYRGARARYGALEVWSHSSGIGINRTPFEGLVFDRKTGLPRQEFSTKRWPVIRELQNKTRFPPVFWGRGKAQPLPAKQPAIGAPIQDHTAFNLEFRPPSAWSLFLPYWLILLTVALPWLALLFWRAWRRRKAITPAASRS
jgi:hypothetical protein